MNNGSLAGGLQPADLPILQTGIKRGSAHYQAEVTWQCICKDLKFKLTAFFIHFSRFHTPPFGFYTVPVQSPSVSSSIFQDRTQVLPPPQAPSLPYAPSFHLTESEINNHSSPQKICSPSKISSRIPEGSSLQRPLPPAAPPPMTGGFQQCHQWPPLLNLHNHINNPETPGVCISYITSKGEKTQKKTAW